ncbi:MAG: contact-dependent growth inhibition system immunity protein [Verrucomicrobiota bacterium]
MAIADLHAREKLTSLKSKSALWKLREFQMENATDKISIADLLGPWVDPDWESGLVDRCRQAWGKPLRDLSNEELATLLRQKIAVEHILPIAKKRVEEKVDDNSEMYDGELKDAVEHGGKNI